MSDETGNKKKPSSSALKKFLWDVLDRPLPEAQSILDSAERH